MTGFAIARALSSDGRWAYTLYGGGEEQFVHALDLSGGRAYCVDLDGLSFDDVSAMHLRARTGRIDVLGAAGDPVRRIDAATFAVTKPRAQDVQQRAAAPADDGAPSDGFPWGLAAAAAAVGAGALVLLRRRYAAGTDSAASRSASSSNPTVP
jgi:hypothetical protein